MTGRVTRRIPSDPLAIVEIRRLVKEPKRPRPWRFAVGDGLEPVDICGLGGTWLLGHDMNDELVEIHPR